MATSIIWRTVFIIGGIISLQEVTGSQDLMMKLTTGFAKSLDACKTELGIGDHIMQDFYNYWNEKYELVNRDTGCMIMCMAGKLNLIDEDMKMHHGNAHEFAKAHGADDDVAKQLVMMLHDCENTHAPVADACNKALEIAKCFRTKIHDIKWAPDMQVLLAEMMTEI